MFLIAHRVSRRPRAFTLVEVLVVLAVLGLLAAILFPAFNSARHSTRLITCQNNERQIGLAFQLYQSDYNRLYPGLRAVPINCSWTSNIAPYVKSNAVFSCPEEPLKSFEPGCPPTKAVGDLRYQFRGAYAFNVPDSIQLSDVRIKAPAQMIVVVDGWGEHMAINTPDNPLSADNLSRFGVEVRHKNGANALFADGHVKWMSLDALTDRSHWTLSGRG